MNQFLSSDKFFLIAGPYVLESEENVMFLAENIKKITDRVGIKYCFMVSWDKANTISVEKYRGLGLEDNSRRQSLLI